jgi:hypothetical protein
MAERPVEAEGSPEVPAHASPAPEPLAASTEETPAEAPTAPDEDFHNPEHWATLTGGVSSRQKCFDLFLKLCRMYPETTIQIQLSATMLQAQPSLYLQVFSITEQSTEEHIILNEATLNTGRG